MSIILAQNIAYLRVYLETMYVEFMNTGSQSNDV